MRTMIYLLLFFILLLSTNSGTAAEKTPSWRIVGNLSEACSCAVPCTCNFTGKPSPHDYCWGLASLAIDSGHYGTTRLNGAFLAIAFGKNGTVFYIQETVSSEQFEALKIIASTINEKLVAYYRNIDPKSVGVDPFFKVLGFKRARIDQQMHEAGNLLQISDKGGFQTDYLIGMDGKSPIKLFNNWAINITDNIKGITKRLYYRDEYGNQFDLKKTNGNQGKFDWSDTTPIYFR